MKLASKLSLGFGTLSVAIIVIGLFGLYQMGIINSKAAQIARHWLPSVSIAQQIDTAISDYRVYEILHAYSEDTAELTVYEGNMETFRTNIMRCIQELKALDTTPQSRKLLEEYEQYRMQYREINAKVIALSRDMKTKEAVKLLLTDSRVFFDKMTEALLRLVNLNTKGADTARDDAQDIFSSAQLLIMVLLGVAICVAVGVTVYMVRSTLRQLGKDPHDLGIIAKTVAGGNLEIAKDGSAVGVYADILLMVENLKKNIDAAHQESERAREESEKAREAMVKADVASKDAQAKRDGMLRAADRLEEVAHVMSSASEELSAQIEQSERGAGEQASRVAETAAAMEQMNSTVSEVARNASEASNVSGRTREKAELGAKIVLQAVSSIHQVQKDSLTLKEDMVKLSSHAQSISQIMGVISDIADQTNLLALNAAIEAARAGEAGRGFAVVADEVRKLAEKTMASTTDVGNAIKAIQNSVDQSMKQVDVAVHNIEDATELATRSGTALNEIVSMVDSTEEQVRAIATASEQQSASSEEINRAITQVNRISGETAQAMAEAARAVSDLASQAQVLSTLIGEMKNS